MGEILPPKEHRTDNGQLWVQTVLSTPATKIEVIQLQQELDKKLLQKQAGEVRDGWMCLRAVCDRKEAQKLLLED